MQAKIRKIGRNHFLVFPKSSVRALSLYAGSKINLDVDDGVLKIDINRRRRHRKREVVMRKVIKRRET